MSFKTPSLLLWFFLSVNLYADLDKASFLIKDGGQKRNFVISKAELHRVEAKSGKSYSHKVSGQTKNTTLLKTAKGLAEGSGDEFQLVLYPKGAKPTPFNRRVLRKEILVEIDKTTTAKALAKNAGAQSYKVPRYAKQYVILSFKEVDAALTKIDAVRALPGVVSAEPQLAKQSAKRTAPNDTLYSFNPANSGYQWHLKNTGENGGTAGVDVNIEAVWGSYTGVGITVGVIDDGLQTDHPDLATNVNTAIDYNWNDGSVDDPSPTLGDSHGTSCAGVIASVSGNSIGGMGAAPDASLVGLRLIGQVASDSQEAESVSWEDQAIDIKSNSWGPPDGFATLDDAGTLVKAELAGSVVDGRGGKGTIHVWAAGNGGDNDDVNYDGYANSVYTIAVGAVTDNGERSWYSDPGAAKLVSAPSNGDLTDQGVTTTTTSGEYTYDFGGTSSATPLVAGIVALMLEANPNLGWRDVQEILVQSARKINPTHSSWSDNGAGIPFSHDYGAGLIDAALAVSMSENWTNLGTHQNYSTSLPIGFTSIPDNSANGVSVSFTVPSN